MDFTLNIYRHLLTTLQTHGCTFQTFQQFLHHPSPQAVILRHDVDKLSANALKMAHLEHDLGVAASYYFRVVPASWDEDVMAQIAALGHEIGYHYEDLAIAGGDHEKAIRHFETWLAQLRRIYPVTTICMHGSPLSRHDNRDLWQRFDYRDFGIIGEPYFDVDFDRVFYLTDTGRRWDGRHVSVRDRGGELKTGDRGKRTDGGPWPVFQSTREIIATVQNGSFPDKVMINVHPQRWKDRPWPWVRELVGQNVKNVIKAFLIGIRREK